MIRSPVPRLSPFRRLAAGGFCAVSLVPETAWVGFIELLAVTALTSPWGGHDCANIGARGFRRGGPADVKKT